MSDWAPHEDWCEYRKEVSRLQGENERIRDGVTRDEVVRQLHKQVMEEMDCRVANQDRLRTALEEVATLRAENERLTMERDMAVEDIHAIGAVLLEQVRQIEQEMRGALETTALSYGRSWVRQWADRLALLVSEKTQEDHARVDRQPTSERRPTASKE